MLRENKFYGGPEPYPPEYFLNENKINNMEEHKFKINYDWTALDIVYELNKITSKHGIEIDFEEGKFDGYEICVVKIDR